MKQEKAEKEIKYISELEEIKNYNSGKFASENKRYVSSDNIPELNSEKIYKDHEKVTEKNSSVNKNESNHKDNKIYLDKEGTVLNPKTQKFTDPDSENENELEKIKKKKDIPL